MHPINYEITPHSSFCVFSMIRPYMGASVSSVSSVTSVTSVTSIYRRITSDYFFGNNRTIVKLLFEGQTIGKRMKTF
jgi:hypothetical protein